MSKGKNIFSELSMYFKSDVSNMTAWMFTSILKRVFPSLGGIVKAKRGNSKVTMDAEIRFILQGISSGVKNISGLVSDKFGSLLRIKSSSIFDGLMNSDEVDWRTFLKKMLLNINNLTAKELERKASETFGDDAHEMFRQEPSGRALSPCFIIDDSVYPKTGKRTELIGKVFDHNSMKSVLGFKGLNLAYFDGKSTYSVDFALVGEGFDNEEHPQGMRKKDIGARFSKARESSSKASERVNEYRKSKPELLKDMVRNATDEGITGVKYVLCDSWFLSKDVLGFFEDEMGIHYIGMAKSNIRFDTEEGELNTAEVARMMKKKESARRKTHGRDANGNKIPKFIKKLYGKRFYGAELECTYKGRKIKVCIFSDNRKDWKAVVCTDMSLSLKEVFEYYQVRWNIEVMHADSKALFNLGKCQQRNFSGQVADMTLKLCVYNIMTYMKRITVYETLGGIFGDMTELKAEVCLVDKIWGMIMEAISSITRAFGASVSSIMNIVLDENKDICALYNLALKMNPSLCLAKLET